MPLASLDEIRARVGNEVGTSSWLTIGQNRIEEFADATEDHQFIHLDPEGHTDRETMLSSDLTERAT